MSLQPQPPADPSPPLVPAPIRFQVYQYNDQPIWFQMSREETDPEKGLPVEVPIDMNQFAVIRAELKLAPSVAAEPIAVFSTKDESIITLSGQFGFHLSRELTGTVWTTLYGDVQFLDAKNQLITYFQFDIRVEPGRSRFDDDTDLPTSDPDKD